MTKPDISSIKFAYVFIAALIQFALIVPDAYAEERRLNIIYTGGLAGQLEPCGCSPKSDFGGVARVAGYLSEHRDELSPYIIVDAGNFTDKDSPQGRLKAEAMIKALGLIRYDAVALSENERIFPADFLKPLLMGQRLPVISEASGYNSSATIEKGTFSINISTDPGGLAEEKLNILLTRVPVSEAKLFTGWDVIVSSAGEEVEEPAAANNVVVVSGYPKGKKLGILSLRQSTDGSLTFEHKWQPVGNDLQEDEAVRGILNEYDRKVAKLMQNAEKPPPGTTFTGVTKCSECHQPFFEQWQSTRHAHAYASLEDVGKAADPECIVCHVVGYGEKGGFFSITATQELSNVQCESCHGLNREHLSDFSPMAPVTEQTCLRCHTKENSPEFDYPVYLEKIKH